MPKKKGEESVTKYTNPTTCPFLRSEEKNPRVVSSTMNVNLRVSTSPFPSEKGSFSLSSPGHRYTGAETFFLFAVFSPFFLSSGHASGLALEEAPLLLLNTSFF